MKTNQTRVSGPAGRRAPAWFADIRVDDETGSRWITADVRLRTPDGGMARGLGAAVRDPGDQSNVAHRLAIARALRDLARLMAAGAVDRSEAEVHVSHSQVLRPCWLSLDIRRAE